MMFDLDIEHYNNKELLGLLSIDENKLYDIIEINSKYQILVNNIQKSNKSSDEKNATCSFLEQVKNKLIINLSNKSNPSTINTLTTAVNPISSQVNPLYMSSSSKSMNLHVEKIITIDTRFRPDYNETESSNFMYTLSQPVTNITKMDLISVEIPQVYCIMSEYYQNSSFTILIDDNEFIINLPNMYLFDHNFSDYSNYDMLIKLCNYYFQNHENNLIKNCSFLLKQFDNNASVIKHVVFILDTTGLTQDEIPSKVELNFQKTSNVSGENRDLRSKLGWMLGFRTPKVLLKKDKELNEILQQDIDISEEDLLNNFAVRADVPIQLSSAKYIYLVVDDFNSNKVDNFVVDDITLKGCDTNISLGGNVLAKILFDSGSQFYTVERLVNTQRQYTGPVDIHRLKISLIDEFGRVLDISKIDWSFSIKLSN